MQYPAVNVRSETELIRRLTPCFRGGVGFVKKLVDVTKSEKDLLWKDNLKESSPEDGKYVRAPFGYLKTLLKAIDQCLVKPADNFAPKYLCGGLSNRGNNIDAALKVLAGQNRTLLKIDLRRYFEQITVKDVMAFFSKCGCNNRTFLRYISELCCVPLGAKGSVGDLRLARGFPTSQRIATWHSLPFARALNKLVLKKLKGHDPKMICIIDDMGITARDVPVDVMESLKLEVLDLAKKFGMEVHPGKTKVISPASEQEFLGIAKLKNTFYPGEKARNRRKLVIAELKVATSRQVRAVKLKSLEGMSRYKKQIRKKATLV